MNETLVDSSAESSTHSESGPISVLFVFMGLLFGALLREVNKKTKIPYTPMLLILGIFLGYFRSSFGTFGHSVEIVEQMSPHMILLIFIPILIFESAFNCDWYVFRKSLFNILLLAGPGVLWGAIIIAFIFKVILGYGNDDLTWYEALTLGSVLSATDPVAVVALLKELGASLRFNTLVEGESLLNDGTAMVFFMLFMGLAKGEESSVLGVVTNFIRTSLGGPLLGLFIGFVISWWMKRIVRDSVLSVNITFIGAFLCFYLAEFTWLKVSGILSIVVLGLYFSAVGKRKIYPESEHALHNVWASIQFASETLIFVLTGIVVGVKMIEETTITWGDWFKMFLFWVLMIIARGIMVLTFYPLLVRSGYGITRKELIVLIYGGLRGALGMCLSLFVGVDESLRLRFRELTVFYMCGMAMLTIVVNGLTCNKLVNYLEMISPLEIKEKLLKRCIKRVLLSTQDRLKELKSETNLSYAKWREVERLAEVKELGNTFHDRKSSIAGRDSLKDLKKDDITEEIRFRFTRYLGKVYWEFYEDGEVSEESIKILNESCDVANDEIKLKLHYFDTLSSNFTMDTMQLYMRFKETPIIGKFIVRSIIQKVYFAYEISLVFVEGCEEVMHQFASNFPLHPDHLKYVMDEVRENVESALSYIGELENNYPKIIQAVHTERAISILLKSKKNKLKELWEEGYVDEKDYSVLRQEIDLSMLRARQANYKLEEIKFNEVITQCPLFSVLSSKEIVTLRLKSKEVQYEKNTKLVLKDKEIQTAYIVISGSIKEEFDGFYLIRSIGSIINPYDFTYKEKSKCTARARNAVKLMEMEEGVINELMEINVEFKKRWYKTLFVYCMHHERALEVLETKFTEKQLRRLIESAEVVVLKTGDSVVVEYGFYVFAGQGECGNETVVRGNYLAKGKTMKALTSVIGMVFDNVIGSREEERISVINE